MKRILFAALSIAAACTSLAILPGSASAASSPFNATAAGYPSGTPLVALATSSTQDIVVSNLPAGVGLYAMHCAVPSDPRTPPVLCDLGDKAVTYMPASTSDTPQFTISMRVNGEFYGMNPNPTGPKTAPASVDCRAQGCSLYVLGAGKESANPDYLRYWPTMFSPVKADRKTDQVTMFIDGKRVTFRDVPVLTFDKPVSFEYKTMSGLTPSFFSDTCSITAGKISALQNSGVCNLTVTTTGGRNFKPLVSHLIIKLVA